MESEARRQARGSLEYALQVQTELMRLHVMGYEQLWGPENNRRTVEEVNAIFDEMDAVQVGQSAMLFQQAWKLAELILETGIADDPTKFLPPYQYSIDQLGHVTVS
jgi:hypothetical protein